MNPKRFHSRSRSSKCFSGVGPMARSLGMRCSLGQSTQLSPLITLVLPLSSSSSERNCVALTAAGRRSSLPLSPNRQAPMRSGYWDNVIQSTLVEFVAAFVMRATAVKHHGCSIRQTTSGRTEKLAAGQTGSLCSNYLARHRNPSTAQALATEDD